MSTNLSQYLDMAEAAELLRVKGKDPIEAIRVRLKRNGVPLKKFGGRVLVLRVSLEEWANRSQKRRRR